MLSVVAMQLTLIRAAIAAALASTACPALAETLVRNVNGIQSDSNGEIAHFSAFLIGDDGKVSAVFRPGEVQPQSGSMVDLGGKTVLPGLIDAHGHIMGLGEAILGLDLSGATSLADMQARLAAYASANPDLPWIVGRGWNQESLASQNLSQGIRSKFGDCRSPGCPDPGRRPRPGRQFQGHGAGGL